MSLVTQVSDLATRVGTEFKAVRATTGALTSLTTTNKTNLVAAINEVKAGVGAGGTVTADAITDATTVGKAVLKAADAAAARTAIGATTVGASVFTAADATAARTAIGAGTSNLAVGTTAADAKAGNWQPTAADISNASTVGRNVLTAVDAAAARTAIGAGTSNLALGTTASTAKAGNYQPTAANISDATAVGRSVLTAATAAAARTALDVLSPSEVDTRIQGIVGSAPAALDTLAELATALGGDANFSATVTTALSNRVRVDAAQSLTAPQQLQARSNIGAVAAADVGNTDTNFVTVFEAALV